MRHLVSRALGLALVVTTLAACANPPEETIEAPVSGGVLLDAGALANETAPPASADIALPATTVLVATALPTTSTASTTLAPRATTTTRAPSSTSPPRPPAPSTTEAELIGDGPMLTVPTGDGTEETPTFGDGPRPAFFALSAETTVKCTEAKPGTVRLTWEVIGAETVDIAVGNSRTILSADQPPAGTLDVPLDCAAGSRYYVVAANPEGETIRSVSVSKS